MGSTLTLVRERIATSSTLLRYACALSKAGCGQHLLNWPAYLEHRVAA